MSQNYGALRVVRVRPPVNAGSLQDRYPTGWLPEERLVHLLTRRQTTIGRALSNDIVLMDPTVSREHARLVLDEQGWHLVNLTMKNIVRVNGQPVQSGESIPMQAQDVVVLGSTMLQLIAPQATIPATPATQLDFDGSIQQPTPLEPLSTLMPRPATPSTKQDAVVQTPTKNGRNGHKEKVPALPFSSASLPVQPEPEQAAQPWHAGRKRAWGRCDDAICTAAAHGATHTLAHRGCWHHYSAGQRDYHDHFE